MGVWNTVSVLALIAVLIFLLTLIGDDNNDHRPRY